MSRFITNVILIVLIASLLPATMMAGSEYDDCIAVCLEATPGPYIITIQACAIACAPWLLS